MSGDSVLTICPTPIGNLADISDRQRQALAAADIIACEDTRVTGKLLELLGIARTDGTPRLWRFDDHNEDAQISGILEALRDAQEVVLVSDAGMPCVADPGFRLIRALANEGLPYDVLPGANAALVALVASGLPIDRFVYAGFLSAKSGARREEILKLHQQAMTWCIYEAPHRLLDTLTDVAHVCGEGHGIFIGRELTKLHQEYVSGSASEVIARMSDRDRVRGECVVVVAAGPERAAGDHVTLDALVAALDAAKCSPQQVKAIASRLLGVSKGEAYDALQAAKDA